MAANQRQRVLCKWPPSCGGKEAMAAVVVAAAYQRVLRPTANTVFDKFNTF